MTANDRRIPELQQMLRNAHGAVVKGMDGIMEPEIRQVPALYEWTVAQLVSYSAEIQYFRMEKAALMAREDDHNITPWDVENGLRSAVIVDHAGDSLDELFQGMVVANESAVTVTGRFTTDDLGVLVHRGETTRSRSRE